MIDLSCKFIVHFIKKKGQWPTPTHSHPCNQHTVREKHSDHYWCSAKATQGSKCSSLLCVGCLGCCVPQPHNLGGWNHQSLIEGDKNLLPRGIKSSWDDKKEKKKGGTDSNTSLGRVSQRAALFLKKIQQNSMNVWSTSHANSLCTL